MLAELLRSARRCVVIVPMFRKLSSRNSCSPRESELGQNQNQNSGRISGNLLGVPDEAEVQALETVHHGELLERMAMQAEGPEVIQVGISQKTELL